jgi:hypothetical protein
MSEVPTVEGKTYEEWVTEYEQVTNTETAQEAAGFLFGYGGDRYVEDEDGEEHPPEEWDM